MFDTHCHLTSPQLRSRTDQIIAEAGEQGVDRMITVGTTPDDCTAAREVAERFENVWYTAGVHPHYASDVKPDDLSTVIEHARHPRCVAIGEMGLDYHYPDPPRDVQQRFFRDQLAAVAQAGHTHPIIIHCREAVDDTLAIIEAEDIPAERFVFHCFTELPEAARKVLDAGCMVSFTGIVTFNSADHVRESAKLVPLERMMIETDSPYCTPEPHRKVRPNEPRYVADVARFLAELRLVDFDEFITTVDANAERFFGIPPGSPGE